jgi:hypothetical protein
MVTRNKRSMAQERIEKAKIAYDLAEKQTDNLLMRFAASPWTLAASAAMLVAVVVILIL